MYATEHSIPLVEVADDMASNGNFVEAIEQSDNGLENLIQRISSLESQVSTLSSGGSGVIPEVFVHDGRTYPATYTFGWIIQQVENMKTANGGYKPVPDNDGVFEHVEDTNALQTALAHKMFDNVIANLDPL